MFLLDTNIVSELRRPSCHGAVRAWRASVPAHRIAIPAIVIAELQDGAEIARRQDRIKAIELEQWIDRVMAVYAIIPMDGEMFREWSRLMAGKSDHLMQDAMVAATARLQHMIVVTRNVRDFEPFEVEVYNPFAYRATESD
ncbi:MAG: type II toxin-antitoxin system VapC family toxin [Terracidiphilus sp.]